MFKDVSCMNADVPHTHTHIHTQCVYVVYGGGVAW